MKLKTSKVIYVDVDGTICQNRDDLRDQDISIAYSDVKPYTDRISQINALYDEGHEIVYMTARGLKSGRGETYYRPITEEQLKSWGCKYHELSFKIHDADFFIDDKGISDTDFFK